MRRLRALRETRSAPESYRNQNSLFYKEGPLEEVYVEITRNCNLNCIHCYLPTKTQSFMSPNLFRKIVDESSALGSYGISLTGGEPLLHKELINFIKYSYDSGFLVNVQSNLTLINEDIIKKFAKYNVSITTSVDGLNEVHDWMRGLKGCFNKVINAIKLCKEYGLLVRVNITINKKNINHIRELLLLLMEIGVDDINLFYVIQTGRALKHLDALSIPIEQYVEVSVRNNDILKYEQLFMVSYGSSNITLCGTCETFYFINVYGDVTICPAHSNNPKFYLGNVNTSSLREIHYSRKREELLEKIQCRYRHSCPYARGCKGGCRSRAYYATGQPDAPDIAFCNIWRRLFGSDENDGK